MDIHVCKQCGSRFVYCRTCVFRPIRYKDNGFCSKECYEASNNKVEPIVEKVSEIILAEDIAPVEEVISVEVEPEIIVEEESSTETDVPTEDAITETNAVVEPTIKKETNTYKKKKNKYKYTSSY